MKRYLDVGPGGLEAYWDLRSFHRPHCINQYYRHPLKLLQQHTTNLCCAARWHLVGLYTIWIHISIYSKLFAFEYFDYAKFTISNCVRINLIYLLINPVKSFEPIIQITEPKINYTFLLLQIVNFIRRVLCDPYIIVVGAIWQNCPQIACSVIV